MDVKRAIMIDTCYKTGGATKKFYDMCFQAVKYAYLDTIGKEMDSSLAVAYDTLTGDDSQNLVNCGDREKAIALAFAMAYPYKYIEKGGTVLIRVEDACLAAAKRFMPVANELGLRMTVYEKGQNLMGTQILIVTRSVVPDEEVMGVFCKAISMSLNIVYKLSQNGSVLYIGEEKQEERKISGNERLQMDLKAAISMQFLFNRKAVMDVLGPVVKKDIGDYNGVSLSELVKKAAAGDEKACYELAGRYRVGTGGAPRDMRLAMERYYSVLQRQRNAKAAFYIGEGFEQGTLGWDNAGKALEWIGLASEWGLGIASIKMGDYYFRGTFVAQDYDKALEYYRKAAADENLHAYYKMGRCYQAKKDYEKAKSYYEKGIEAEREYEGYLGLAELYLHGYGVPKDGGKALLMYSHAEKHGMTEAKYQMGIMYYEGDCIGQSYYRAFELFQDALKEGKKEANYYIGCIYSLDKMADAPVMQNYEKALRFLDDVPEGMKGLALARKGFIFEEQGRAAEAQKCYAEAEKLGAVVDRRKAKEGSSKSQIERLKKMGEGNINELLVKYKLEPLLAYFIGDSYLMGTRKAKVNYDSAVAFLTEAARQDGPFQNDAKYELAYIYKKGLGVSKNAEMSWRMLQEAAAGGHADACMRIAIAYDKGKFVTQDRDEAISWFEKACERGSNAAKLQLGKRLIYETNPSRENVQKAMGLLENIPESAKEYPDACEFLAECYLIGVIGDSEMIVPPDHKKAVRFLEYSAKQGKPSAFCKVGDILMDSASPAFDVKGAEDAFMSGVKKGDKESLLRLAELYFNPDNRKYNLYHTGNGMKYAKRFLEEGPGDLGKKEEVIGMVLRACREGGGNPENRRVDYIYLMNHMGKMNLAYSKDSAKEMLMESMKELVWDFIDSYGDVKTGRMGNYGSIISILDGFTTICEHNSYLKDCGWEYLMEAYDSMAKSALQCDRLYDAKACFQKAADMGFTEATYELVHFKKNLFGELRFV